MPSKNERKLKKALNYYRDSQISLSSWFEAERTKRELLREYRLLKRTARVATAQYAAVVEQNKYLQRVIKENQKCQHTYFLKAVWKQLGKSVEHLKALALSLLKM